MRSTLDWETGGVETGCKSRTRRGRIRTCRQQDRMQSLPRFLPSAHTPSCASPYCFDGTSFTVARSLQTFRVKRGIVFLRFAIVRSCFRREHTPVSRPPTPDAQRSVDDGLSVRLIMVLGESNQHRMSLAHELSGLGSTRVVRF